MEAVSKAVWIRNVAHLLATLGKDIADARPPEYESTGDTAQKRAYPYPTKAAEDAYTPGSSQAYTARRSLAIEAKRRTQRARGKRCQSCEKMRYDGSHTALFETDGRRRRHDNESVAQPCLRGRK